MKTTTNFFGQSTLALHSRLMLFCACVLIVRPIGAQQAWETPTEAEVEVFAGKLLESIDSGDSKKVNELIDWGAILDRATKDIKAPKAASNFRALFLANINNDGQLAGDLVRIHKGGGSYTALNRRVERGFGRSMFRLVLPGGEFNYHDFAVAKQSDGTVRAVDIYVFLTGETMSQTLRRSFLPSAVGEDKRLSATLGASEKAFLNNVSSVNEFNAAIQANDQKAALALFAKFPEELKKEKNVLILRLLAAQQVSMEELALAINDFARFHPNDGCMKMLSIDAFAMQKDFEKAIEAVSGLERLVGDDPYLKLVKSNIYQRAGDRDNAMKMVKQAVAEDDYMLEAYWSLLGFSIQDKDNAKILEMLKLIDTKFQISFNDLSKVPQYADFVSSQQYKSWLDYLAAKKKD